MRSSLNEDAVGWVVTGLVLAAGAFYGYLGSAFGALVALGAAALLAFAPRPSQRLLLFVGLTLAWIIVGRAFAAENLGGAGLLLYLLLVGLVFSWGRRP